MTYTLRDGKTLAGANQPTDPQKGAGNYEKAHPIVHGMRVSIENAAGTTRTGMTKGGKVWSSKMAHDYGYIRGTKGKDKDHIDVYLGPDPHGDHPVHVIDQNHVEGDNAGQFDEHKAMVGFPSVTHAIIAYHQNFDPGWNGFRSVTSMPTGQFKDWAYSGNDRGKQKPAADYVAFKSGANDVDQTGPSNSMDPRQDQRPGVSQARPGMAAQRPLGSTRDAAPGFRSEKPIARNDPTLRARDQAGNEGRAAFASGGYVRQRLPDRQERSGHPGARHQHAGNAPSLQRIDHLIQASGAGSQKANASTGRSDGSAERRPTQDLESGTLTALPHGNVWSAGGVSGMPNLKLDGPSFAKGGLIGMKSGGSVDAAADKAADKAQKQKDKDDDAAAMAALRASPRQNQKRSHPMEISTRVPTSAKSEEDSIKNLLTVGLDSSKGKPSAFQKNVGIVTGYPNYKDEGAKTPDEHAEAFINHVKDNLLFLHDKMPLEVRNRAMKWYEGANKIANDMAERHGIQPHQAAGMLAALSPQTDWLMNVSLAHRVADALHNKQDHPWTPEMESTSADIFGKPQYKDALDAIRGKTLGQLDEPTHKAMWIRAHDQAHNDRSYNDISPEGDVLGKIKTAKSENATAAWGNLPNIAKAVSLYKNSTLENISGMLGSNHKVRNFYNNILDPNSPNGHVTIDTHAVAGGLLRPLSGSSAEVTHNFGGGLKGEVGTSDPEITGANGTYGLYAEAYRRAAAERGMLPRQMQSITWEGARNLFTNKQQKQIDAANAIWENHRHGQLSARIARQRILDASRGIDSPSWYGPGAGASADQGAGDAGVVPQLRVPGRGAGPVVGGRGSLLAAAAAGPGPVIGAGRLSSKRSAVGTGTQGLSDGGSVSGSQGQLEAPVRKDRKHARFADSPLKGLPTPVEIPGHGKVDVGPLQHIRDAAADYMQRAGLLYKPPTDYVKVDKDRAARIAQAYDDMPHEPGHPAVKAAYDQMIKEVKGQYEAALRSGLKVDFIQPDQPNPYAASPRLATEDVRHNNHMWVFPTASGFGSTPMDVSDNPLLADMPEHKINGQPTTANDLFRVVHDYFGHMKEGVGFRADGEENAWRHHSAMFSPLARRAMTNETRGQNSWVNYWPHGDANRTASSDDTHFADQKTGLMPHWVHRHGSGQDDDDEVPGYAKGGSIPSDKHWRACMSQGGRVVAGRLHLDDGGSAGDAGDTGDPGTGDPGAAGIGSGEMGTDAPGPSNGGDAGLATTLADMQASMSPNLSSNQNGMFSGTSPSTGSGVMGFLGNIAANVAAHAAGLPAGIVGMTNAAIHGSAPAAASTMGGVLGGIIGSGLGPVGSVVGSVAGNAIGNAVGNMPGVPASSVAADPTGHSASPSASASAAPSASVLAGLSPAQLDAYRQAMAMNDPMGTRQYADSSGNGGSAAVYGAKLPGNWGSGMQNGWGFASGGSIPHAQIRLLGGPLSRGAGRMNGR